MGAARGIARGGAADGPAPARADNVDHRVRHGHGEGGVV